MDGLLNKLKHVAMSIFILVFIATSVLAFETTTVNATSKTQSEAVNWVCARGNEGWNVDIDNYAGCQCVDLIVAYYKYLGVTSPGGNAKEYAGNKLPSGWTRVYSNPKAGDIVVWGAGAQMGWYPLETSYANGTNGHIGVIHRVNSSGTISTIETNASQGSKAAYYERYTNNVACYIRPNFASAVWYANKSINNIGDDFWARMVLTSTKIAPGVNASTKNVENVSYSSKTEANYRSQSWHFVRNSDGSYRILNGYYKNLPLEAVGKASGTNVKLGSSYTGSDAQHWFIYGAANGQYIIRNKASEFVLNVDSAKTASGTNLQIWKYTDSVAERMTIEKHQWYDIEKLNNLGDSFCARIVLKSTGIAPGVNSSTGNVENVSYSAITDANYRSQYWNFTRNSDGSYKILNVYYTNRPLEAVGTSSGTNVKLGSSYTGSNAQHWYIYGDGNGQYIIRNKASQFVLNVHNAYSAAGTNLQIWKYTDSTAERMTIEKHTSHQWNSGKVTTPATCTDQGVKLYTCTVCGATKTSSIAKLGHKYSSTYTVDKKATTSADGSKSQHCTRSGCTEKSVTEIPKISSVNLSTVNYTYNGSTKTPTVTVTDSEGTTLKDGTDYTVSYESGRTKIGEYKVTVTFKGNYSGTVEKTFKIKLATPKISISNVASSGAIKLSWKAVEGADRYEIQRSVGNDDNYVSYKTTTSTSFTNTATTAGKTYYYRVRAIYDDKSSLNSAWGYEYQTCDLAAPEITVSGTKKPGKIVISWSKVSGADRYYIYRATSKNGTYSKYDTTTSTTYTNSSVTKGKYYYYKVIAVYDGKSSANSAYSNMDYAWVR